jgi:hypothetical protein
MTFFSERFLFTILKSWQAWRWLDKQVEASGRYTMQVVVYDGVVVKYMLYKYMLHKYMLYKYLLHQLNMNLTSYEV